MIFHGHISAILLACIHMYAEYGFKVDKMDLIISLLSGIWEWLLGVVPGGKPSVVGLVGAIIGGIAKYLSDTFIFKKYRHLNNKIDDLQDEYKKCDEKRKLAETKVRKVNKAINSSDLWSRTPFKKPKNYQVNKANSVPILLIANLKGGVGKSTVASNLVAYFDNLGERVLAIDLDYQGSMSTLLQGKSPNDNDAELTKALLSPDIDINRFFNMLKPARAKLPNTKVIPTYQPFDIYENQLLLKWLIDDVDAGVGFTPDARYFLAKILHSPELKRSSNNPYGFDRIIIDAPPRMAIGFVNGLCASTHLLIPTVLDGLSVKAVEHMLTRVQRMEDLDVFSKIKMIGVVGTQSTNSSIRPAISRIQIAEGALEGIVTKHLMMPGYYLKDAFIPENADISAAAGENQVAYIDYPNTKPIFDRLGEIVKTRMDT